MTDLFPLYTLHTIQIMNTLQRTLIFFTLAMAAITLSCCIEDDISTSPSDQPEFSADTVFFGSQFSNEVTSTMMLMVYNRHDKVMSINNISLKDGGHGVFRLNVDGQSGTRFSNIEIRPNDSIYVLVAAKFDVNGSYAPIEVEDELQFLTNGVTKSVILNAVSLDVERLTDPVISADTQWEATHPRRIYGTLTVAPGATLTLGPGVTLYFHDKARMQIDGTLITEGTAESPVEMRGDRLGSVVGDIPFDLMASQWDGVRFSPSSTGSRMAFTEIRNTANGVRADTTTLSLTNCRLRNAAGNTMLSMHSTLTAVGCEFAEAGEGPLVLHGGEALLSNCTLSNYYLFAAITGPLLRLEHTDADNNDESSLPYLQARIENSILYGSGTECNLKSLDPTKVDIINCLLRSKGDNDDHFISCMWDSDPLFYTVRADYLFDYRLKPESPAIGASSSSTVPLPATDFYGAPRQAPPSLGAYEPKATE